MVGGLYISAAGLKVNERQSEVQANNLANVNTVGFKLDRVLAETVRTSQRTEGPGGGRGFPGLALLGSIPLARQTVTDLSAGPVESTGQPLDIALDTGGLADGFLGVSGPGGQACWTRDGRLAADPSGRLVTQAGRWAVLDEKGQPIRVDASAGPVAIDGAGRIRQGSNDVARLRLATFSQPHRLTKLGAGLFAAGGDSPAARFRGQVVQGHLEGSAVQPTAMLALLIQTQRAYEANANMIRLQDQTLGRAVNDIARIG